MVLWRFGVYEPKRYGGNMQVGDLVWSITYGRMGVILSVDWHTDIGTPFDYGVYYFDTNEIEGTDQSDDNLEVLCK